MPYALLVVAGEREGETFLIPEDRALTLGRDTANDIRLLDRKLSRIHCQVEVIGGRCQLTDLNSTNGTLVNGRRIEAETWISPDDEVEVGMTRMRLIEVAPVEVAVADKPRRAPKGSARADEPPTVESAPTCEECGKPIAPDLIASGKVRAVGGRFYCLDCSPSFDRDAASSTDTHGVMEPAGVSAQHLPPGREIAGVRIINLIGEGRLGPLYKGEQVSMGRLVALKVLNVPDAEWAQKYLHAVYTSGQLVHTNIALIFDTGEEESAFYVVREFVEGQSVHERLANREPLPLAEAYSIITQVAYALEHAFERHICHGGLSPRKIILGPRDTVKVTGFGLPQTPPPGRSASSYTWHSLPYTPPERLRGEESHDFAGDVYSAVAIFYHLLTGRPPFTGSTRDRIEHRILNHPPRALMEFSPQAPAAAQKIIDRGLSKNPRARYQLPRELLFDFEETLRREM